MRDTLRLFGVPTLVVSAFFVLAPSVDAQTWIDGEMGYRVTVVPSASPAARAGLRLGDMLAEPVALVSRLRDAGSDGVAIPLYRLDTTTAAYTRTTLKIVFMLGEEKRLGTTGDLGFVVTGVKPGSLGARAELKVGDFIPKIDETFVHDVKDLRRVDDAYEKGEQVMIQFIRWFPDSADFKTLVSRRRFVK